MRQSNHSWCELVDLATDLLAALAAVADRPVAEQIAVWQAFYASREPELPGRLYRDYERFEGGWRQVAEERIFPAFAGRLATMRTALASVLSVAGEVCDRAAELFGIRRRVVVVVYVGLGNGAGWATQWQGQPAVLVGLENVAELGWQSEASIRGLLGHELGHLMMNEIRGADRLPSDDALAALYEEGFAQHAEHVLTGRATWHCSSQEGWLGWCREHEGELAGRFLATTGDREAWRRFFGSWHDVEGWRQTGYYLGCRFVEKAAGGGVSLGEIAAWPVARVRESVRRFLEEAARKDE